MNDIDDDRYAIRWVCKNTDCNSTFMEIGMTSDKSPQFIVNCARCGRIQKLIVRKKI